jgi:hypothetical protein
MRPAAPTLAPTAPLALVAALALALALAGTGAAAAAAPRLRFTAIGKDSATLRVTLDEPATAEVVWGEEPGNWTGSATAAQPAALHELQLAKLAPSRQYFYQVRVPAGDESGDVLTFHSGRSWVTRQAVLQVVAHSPPEAGSRLADRVYLDEADALVVLGAGEAEVESIHLRSMANRLVLAAAAGGAEAASVADLAFRAGDSAPPAPRGACWLVAASEIAGADIVVVAGTEPSIARGAPLRVTVTPGAYARVEAEQGRLSVTLRDAAGTVLASAETSKECPIPKAEPLPEVGAGETHDADGEASSADCGT